MNYISIAFYVFIGGGLGSLSRFGISKLSSQIFDSKLPIGTLLANTLACAILGITLFYIKDKIDTNLILKYFIVIGFCGGFSTFSTFGMETVTLLKDGLILYGTLNILLSLSLGFVILWVLT